MTGRAAAAGLIWGALALAGSAGMAIAAPGPLFGDPAHADLSGIWVSGPANYDWVDYGKGAELPLTPKYAEAFRRMREMSAAGKPIADPVTKCLAFGMPRFMTMDFTLVQTPGQITMYTEVLHEIREIYMDGRPAPQGLDPTWRGRSNGHWEGDTLVVETVGMKAGGLDQAGVAHSDKLKVVERIHRAGDTLLDEITLIDPEAYTRPWTVTRHWQHMAPGYEFAEYICENQRNAPDAQGITTVDGLEHGLKDNKRP